MKAVNLEITVLQRFGFFSDPISDPIFQNDRKKVLLLESRHPLPTYCPTTVSSVSTPPSCLHMKNDGCLTRHPSVDSYSLCNKLDMIIKPLYCLVLHCLKHISIRVERHMDVCMAQPGFENNCRHSRLYTPRSECMPQLMLSV